MARSIAKIALVVVAAGAGLGIMLASAKAPDSDPASPSRYVGKLCTVYLKSDPIAPPSSGGTAQGVMTKNDTPIRVLGRLTGYDTGIAVVREGNVCHLIRTDNIIMISVND